MIATPSPVAALVTAATTLNNTFNITKVEIMQIFILLLFFLFRKNKQTLNC